MVNRILYLGYYLKQLDGEKFDKFLNYTVNQTGKSSFGVKLDVFASIFQYNISLLEYFQFRFFEKSHEEKLSWAGTGFMYEYQLKMNPPNARGILDDKRQFSRQYREFLVHGVEDLASIKDNEKGIDLMLINPSGKLVFKSADGKCGAQVDIVACKDFSRELVFERLQSAEYDLVEEYIIQHPDLHALSPSAVNTIRIFTQLNEQDEVEILGCRLRISVNSPVDNMAAGNLAAPLDEFTGQVTGPGVYSDITKVDEEIHPITGVKIVGFQVPFWKESLEMVKRAALKHPQNRSVGWDVVITDRGPGLIEGNHDWCKLLWQLPVKKGLRNKLEMYLV